MTDERSAHRGLLLTDTRAAVPEQQKGRPIDQMNYYRAQLPPPYILTAWSSQLPPAPLLVVLRLCSNGATAVGVPR